jgi:hypothetical protein
MPGRLSYLGKQAIQPSDGFWIPSSSGMTDGNECQLPVRPEIVEGLLRNHGSTVLATNEGTRK